MEVIKHVHKLCRQKADSFWYYGQHIATVINGDRRLSIEARGEIAVQFKEDGETFRDEKAIEEAERLKLGDAGLGKIALFDGFKNNNWFAICPLDSAGNVGDDIEIAHTYDEVIELAKTIIQTD